MKLLSLTLPGYGPVEAPAGVPTGGMETGEKILQLGVNVFFIGSIIITLFLLIWAGIDFIISEGDKASIELARRKIAFAILGLCIIFMTMFGIQIFGHFFGIKLLYQNTSVDCSTRQNC